MSTPKDNDHVSSITSSSSTGGHGNTNSGQFRGRGSNHNKKKTSNLKGLIDELGDAVYLCGHEDTHRKSDFRKMNEAVMLYITTTLSDAEDILCVFEHKYPKDLFDEAALNFDNLSEGKRIVKQEELKLLAKKQRAINTNLRKTFMIIWSQCTQAMQASLKGEEEYEGAKEKADCVWLMNKIRFNMLEFMEDAYLYLSLNEARTKLCTFKQKYLSCDDYLQEFALLT